MNNYRISNVIATIIAVAIMLAGCLVMVGVWNFSQPLAILVMVIVLIGVAIFTIGLVKAAGRELPAPISPPNEALTRPTMKEALDSYFDYDDNQHDPYGDIPGDYDK